MKYSPVVYIDDGKSLRDDQSFAWSCLPRYGVYPRLQPGSKSNGASYIFYTVTPLAYSTHRSQYAVYNNPDRDPYTARPKDYHYTCRKNPGDVQSYDDDLAPFVDEGRELLHRHGQTDQIITSEISPLYRRHVQETLGAASAEVDDFIDSKD